MAWADGIRRMEVRANADTPEDARAAVRFGAQGIGLCRTEHMFFDAGRIVAMREMIVASDAGGRRAALAKILPMQRKDFVELFRIMEGRPVTIRLLDPPLHEFLPQTEEEMAALAAAAGTAVERPSSKRSTRCSAIAAAASASRTPKSTRCKPGRCSRPGWRSAARRAARWSPRS
jgi:pyruvate,orthophosphate dikinase